MLRISVCWMRAVSNAIGRNVVGGLVSAGHSATGFNSDKRIEYSSMPS